MFTIQAQRRLYKKSMKLMIILKKLVFYLNITFIIILLL